MNEKHNRLVGKRALIASLVLGYSSSIIEASIPYFAGLTDESKSDARIAIGSNITTINGMKRIIESYITGTNYNPNQKILLGYYLHVIFYAACLSNANALDELLKKDGIDLTVKTALGNTPMHVAAINSPACLTALISDGHLNVNEHNSEGKTPLYLAMENNQKDSHKTAIETLLAAPSIQINSLNSDSQTMLHIAVINGDANVVMQILAINNSQTNVNAKDKDGFTAANYLDTITKTSTKKEINNLLAAAGAKYGLVTTNDKIGVAHTDNTLVTQIN